MSISFYILANLLQEKETKAQENTGVGEEQQNRYNEGVNHGDFKGDRKTEKPSNPLSSTLENLPKGLEYPTNTFKEIGKAFDQYLYAVKQKQNKLIQQSKDFF